MPRFLYKAVSADGEIVEGELDATDRQAVIDRLHAQGHVPIRAEPSRETGGRRRALPRLFQARRMTRKDLVLLTQELHRAAVQEGMRTMYDDGMAKALDGLTTVEEILRVTRDT